jgi:hypothetical protein
MGPSLQAGDCRNGEEVGRRTAQYDKRRIEETACPHPGTVDEDGGGFGELQVDAYPGEGEMKVLVACEFSGIVRDAFKARGHDAWSCDLLSTEKTGQHIQGDVLNHLNEGWDLMIAHPPCTYLCNTAVSWFYRRPERWNKLPDARNFFYKLLNADISKICIENPIPHKYFYDNEKIRKYDQIIQPWMFGHGETKATCLWLKNLPKLQPTKIMTDRKQRIFLERPGNERWKNRSRTLHGIATAMAEQWG